MTDEPPPTRALPDVLEQAALALADSIITKSRDPESDLIELTKAFTVVADYATDRAKAQAESKPKEGAKVDALRSRFNGEAYSGRGRPRKGQTSPGSPAANGGADTGTT